ncbi:MAG: hypothetical protein JWR16_1179 [Nevskia sp.]|nr:hypothetical protein [Nevskia sp.]
MLALCVAACSGTQVTKGAGGQTITQARAEAANGIKYRVAVGQIIDKTDPLKPQSIPKQLVIINADKPQDQQLNADSITHGIRDMITTELFDTGQFIVLERQNLDDATSEQEFSQSARVGDATRIPLGQLEGAELLVVGAITAFDAGVGKEGGAIPIPIPLGSFSNGAAILNLSFKRGFVAMELRVIDVATGRILASEGVEGKNTKYGLKLAGLAGGNFGYIPLPGNLVGFFKNTPVEEALQKMVAAAIGKIAAQHPSKEPVGVAPPLAMPVATSPAPVAAKPKP